MKTLLNCLLFTKVDKLIVYQPIVNFIISKNQTVIVHRYLCSNISSRYGSRNEVAQLLAINWSEGKKKKKKIQSRQYYQPFYMLRREIS